MMQKVEKLIRKFTGCKNASVDFFITLKTGTLHPDCSKVEINRRAKRGIIYNVYGGKKIEETIWFSWDDEKSLWKRSIKNISGRKLQLLETGFHIKNIDFGKKYAPSDDFFYHVENPRVYNMMTVPVNLNLTRGRLVKQWWVDPVINPERIGTSPYQPFPAILISNYKFNKGIVHGSLSQKVFYHNYAIRRRQKKTTWTVFSSVKTVAYRNFLPDEVIDGDMWYLGMACSQDIGMIFSGYLSELRKHLPASWGRTSINRHSIVWGSANDGVQCDIDQERILKTAAFIKENLPTVNWVQIDWGYGIGGYYKGGLCLEGFDRKKFPEGLKIFADRIKQIGLSPALWISAITVDKTTLIAKEHPEWLYERKALKNTGVLDISLPEVRNYMEKSLDMLLRENGFEGLKHDFWSYTFEDTGPFLSVKDKSGYELRNWWLSEIRKRLPPWGYLQTGTEIGMGNPFLGEYCNNYRYGIDINKGCWDYVKNTILWGFACFATHSGDLFVPNSDAIGMMEGLNDNEFLLWINYCIISRSLVEIAGWLHKNHKKPRFYYLKKAICCPNNGQDVFFCDHDYRTTHNPADKWYFHGPHFSLIQDNPHLPVRTVAVFNLTDRLKNFHLNPEQLGLEKGKYAVTDAWSLKTSSIRDYENIKLKPHSSVLFSINMKYEELQIYDSDVKIEQVFKDKDALSVKLAYKGAFRIAVSFKPGKVVFPDKNASIKTVKGQGNWVVEGNTASGGILKLFF